MDSKYNATIAIFSLGLLHEFAGLINNIPYLVTIGVVMMSVAFVLGLAIAMTDYLKGK